VLNQHLRICSMTHFAKHARRRFEWVHSILGADSVPCVACNQHFSELAPGVTTLTRVWRMSETRLCFLPQAEMHPFQLQFTFPQRMTYASVEDGVHRPIWSRILMRYRFLMRTISRPSAKPDAERRSGNRSGKWQQIGTTAK
jgi:hypothetical protein